VYGPRTYFNPADNQAMGWSIPAGLGAQRAFPCRQTVIITGDGCFMMSAMELSTAAREGLPVKAFVLDNQCYQYMQEIQKPAYLRTTATILARLDYAALATAFGVGYHEICVNQELDYGIEAALYTPGPALIRVSMDFAGQPCRWIDAVSDRFVDELSSQQKVRFLTRIGSRALDFRKQND
jgi:acetolactate synthase-1/2/3 large subunit